MKRKFIIFITALLMITTIETGQRKVEVMAATGETDNTILMDNPPFEYFISDQTKAKKNKPIRLKMKECRPNKITDDENWFKNNKLSLRTYQVSDSYQYTTENLPDEIDINWDGLIITSAFYDASYIYCTYGSDYSEGYIMNIYDAKTFKVLYSMDFTNYRYSPDYIEADYDFIQQKINWAVIKGNILYVSHSHSTYAKSSKNMNAYITAIDLKDKSIIWRTKALVSNSNNFIIVGNVIICGYGFTAEPDYLYQIDIGTGKVLKKTLLKSAISYIIKKGNYIYVRTYNTDYKFNIMK